MLLLSLTSEITVQRATNMIYNYHKFQSEKSISVVYPIDKLKIYLDKCLKDGNTDVRLYFGQYGDNTTLNSDQKDYTRHRTIVFVPVKCGEDNFKGDPNIVTDPYNEGELCPPKHGCEDHAKLYMNSQSTNPDEYNPTDIA